MEQSGPQQMNNIHAYHSNDVLCGRGPKQNQGNFMHRGLIKENKQRYMSCGRVEKRSISKSIVSAIRNQNPPGRFLEKNASTGLWYDIGDERAVEKTKQALREAGVHRSLDTDESKKGSKGSERGNTCAASSPYVRSKDKSSEPDCSRKLDEQLQCSKNAFETVEGAMNKDCFFQGSEKAVGSVKGRKGVAARAHCTKVAGIVQGSQKKGRRVSGSHQTHQDNKHLIPGSSQKLRPSAISFCGPTKQPRFDSDGQNELNEELGSSRDKRDSAFPSLATVSEYSKSSEIIDFSMDTSSSQFTITNAQNVALPDVGAKVVTACASEHNRFELESDCKEERFSRAKDAATEGSLDVSCVWPTNSSDRRDNAGASVSVFANSIGESLEDNVDEQSPLLVKRRGVRSVYRLEDAKNRLGGQTGAVAIKLLTATPDGVLDPGEISRLYNEYILSRHVSRCPAVRSALKYDSQVRFHAVYLEWVWGVTLREWIRTFHDNFTPGSYETIVAVGLEITRSISMLHAAGIVHNSINADNIIVEENGMDFSVKLIDLGYASLLEENASGFSSSAHSIIDIKRNDLFALGLLLYEVISGNQCDESASVSRPGLKSSDEIWDFDSDRFKSRKSHEESANHMKPPLHELHWKDIPFGLPVPFSLSNLVSNLMERGSSEDRYRSADEVEQDLQMMHVEPMRFLYDMDLDIMTEKLEIPNDRLYGRAAQISMLMDAYNRVVQMDGISEVVMVAGRSGTGKSALVSHIRDMITNKGGYFLSGKFDQLRQVEPLSAIVAAFTGYCEGIIEGGVDAVRESKAAIDEKVGSDSEVLTGLIPSLRKIVGNPAVATVNVRSREAQNRFRVIFRMFIRAIASPSHPVVLFLDDLQWADVASLDVMNLLVSDSESNSFMLIGSYRDNEMTSSSPLASHLKEIEEQGVHITKIELSNLAEDEVVDLITDTLRVSKRLVRPLAEVVHGSTSGNVLFVRQCLQSLREEGLIHFSSDMRSWQWDLKTIQDMMIAEDVLDLMTGKILKLSAVVKGALELAACLGAHCDEEILELMSPEDDRGINGDENDGRVLPQLLDEAVSQGLMDKIGSRYRFTHDQIQHAAYMLIPEKERGLRHLRIGNQIRKNALADKLESVLFVAVDQLNRGADFVGDERERIEIARLNLKAGDKAILSSSFLPAATYLKAGISLLGPGHWGKNYDLTLQLYNSCVETEYCNGNFDFLGQMLSHILAHARSFDDKVRAYYTLVHSLGAQKKPHEAIKICIVVLEELGVPFPTILHDDESVKNSSIKATMASEMMKTNEILNAFNDDELLSLKTMEDERKITAMRFLYPLVLYFYFTKKELLSLVVFRMIGLSLNYGVCKESAFGFAFYALLCSAFVDIRRGYRFGQISLSLLNRFDDKERLARVYTCIYGCVNPWIEHIELCVEPLLHGYRIGMRTGDIEYAMMCYLISCKILLQCGKQLALVEKEMRTCCEQIMEFKQGSVLSLILPYRRTALKLTGRSEDKAHVSGTIAGHDQTLMESLDKHNSTELFHMHFPSLWLAYLYGEYELASEIAQKAREISNSVSTFEVCNFVFFDGLVSLALARKTKQINWTVLAKRAIEKIKNWTAHAPSNCQHKLMLLEAEYAFHSDTLSEAAELYDSAIAAAGENGFLQDQALSYERAAMFHLSGGDESKASSYYDNAYNAYLEWGARAKADHVRCRSLSLLMVGPL